MAQSYHFVSFIDPNDNQRTWAVFSEDYSRVSICPSEEDARSEVLVHPNLDNTVKAVRESGYDAYIAALDAALAEV